jgi:GDPmannose 4,6-dehydratase
MHLMMQAQNPDDWVLATGETHTVKEFAKEAFNQVGLNWEDFVTTSEKYSRPNEVHHLLGSAEKAEKELNWKPETSFDELVKIMVESDLDLAEQEKVLLDNGLIKPTWENSI